MLNFKVSENKTGTVFYSRRGEGANKPYRVRFKSFQLGRFDNRHLMEDLDQMHNNYNVFKYLRLHKETEGAPPRRRDATSPRLNAPKKYSRT